MRLHVRNQRFVPRRRARHAGRHVRARVPGSAAGDLFQGHGAGLRAHRTKQIGIRSRFAVSRRPNRSWRWCSEAAGRSLGYTLANDVSAWDIERENALYLPQSKVYDGCCALGPAMVTPDELTDPYNLEMTCMIERDGKETVLGGSVNTAKLHRKFEVLLEYLLRANPVPAGTVLLTGTGIIVTAEAALAAGDVVTIRVPEIGELRNEAVLVG